MEIEAAIERLGALAQEARLRVFRLLVRAGPEGQPAGELARTLDCAPQTLSFHLKHLVSAGLIQNRREGRSIIYSLRPESVKELLAFLTEDCCQGRLELCVPVGASPRARQADAEARPSVLFVCSKNSARSQMAEALLRHRTADEFDIRSAGIRPAAVHPFAIRVMNELGIDMSSQRAQDLGAVMSGPVSSTAIVVCEQAQQDCGRIYPFALKRLYWPFEDPAACDGTKEERLAKFREVRDAIDARIQEWLAARENKSAQA